MIEAYSKDSAFSTQDKRRVIALLRESNAIKGLRDSADSKAAIQGIVNGLNETLLGSTNEIQTVALQLGLLYELPITINGIKAKIKTDSPATEILSLLTNIDISSTSRGMATIDDYPGYKPSLRQFSHELTDLVVMHTNTQVVLYSIRLLLSAQQGQSDGPTIGAIEGFCRKLNDRSDNPPGFKDLVPLLPPHRNLLFALLEMLSNHAFQDSLVEPTVNYLTRGVNKIKFSEVDFAQMAKAPEQFKTNAIVQRCLTLGLYPSSQQTIIENRIIDKMVLDGPVKLDPPLKLGKTDLTLVSLEYNRNSRAILATLPSG